MSRTTRYVAYTIVIIAVLIVIAILAVLAITYVVRKRRAKQIKTKPRLYSQYSYISPLDPPLFVIPSYACEDDTLEDDSASSLSTITEEKPSDKKGDKEVPINSSPLGTPTISRPQFERSFSEMASGYTRERTRAKYVRTVSTQEALAHRPVRRKSSATPHGKIQVSIQYVTSKSLLVIQVNGMYDLPQLRTSGISTPYVRVNLITSDDDKDLRTNFMNLATNRICVFDRISLDEAKEATLKFIVLDYDKFSRSEFVAQVVIRLSEISLEEGETVMKKLRSHDLPEVHDELGTLTVSLCQQPSASRLIVHVIKAECLQPPSKGDDTTDSYVRVTYYVHKKLVEKHKTKIAKKTRNPLYNEAFVFQLKDEELKNCSITCEVFGLKLKAEKIGLINLGTESYGSELRHWDAMMLSPRKQIVQCHSLHL